MAEPKNKVIATLSRNKAVVAGVVVGLVAYLWWRRRQAAAAGSGAIGTGLPSTMPGGAGSGSTDVTPGAGSTPAFNSLQDWMSHVQTWSNSVGFDAASVQSALQNYSLGNCLDSAGYKVIDQALMLFGQPPGAPYQGVVLCQPSPTAPTPTVPDSKYVHIPNTAIADMLSTQGYDFFQQLADGTFQKVNRWIPGIGSPGVVGGTALFISAPQQAGSYVHIPSAAEANTLAARGTTFYWNPLPGVYLPTNKWDPNSGVGLPGGTPLYTYQDPSQASVPLPTSRTSVPATPITGTRQFLGV